MEVKQIVLLEQNYIWLLKLSKEKVNNIIILGHDRLVDLWALGVFLN